MEVRARAPGKLVLLGEYAVLDGARALVMAVRRYCRARLEPSIDGACRLETRFPDPSVSTFAVGAATGDPLIDAVTAELGGDTRWPAWSGCLDSAEFFTDGRKLGLGSSAAALVAWAGAWSRLDRSGRAPPTLRDLVRAHRMFQGGAGSGLDVAAAYTGGIIDFRLDSDSAPLVGSVLPPNSVGFAGIFPGSSASTPNLVARYDRWKAHEPKRWAELTRRMHVIAEQGYAAARENDGPRFLAAIAEYGCSLGALGNAMGADLVTAEHQQIEQLAKRFDVVYKISGAGGGDLGLACSLDADALNVFAAAAEEQGFHAVELAIDNEGLVIEELAE